MAKKKQTPKKGNTKNTKNQQSTEPWISMRTGLIVVSVMSIGMMAMTGYYTISALGWKEGLVWTLGFGAAIWVVFFGFLYFNRFVRNRKK